MLYRVLRSGPAISIWAILLQDGSCPAEDFLGSLQERDYKRLLSLLERTAQSGLPRNSQKFKKLEGAIFEFKSYQDRLLCFFLPGQVIVATHGVKKKRSGRVAPRSIVRSDCVAISWLGGGNIKVTDRGSLARDISRYAEDPEFVAEGVALEILECVLDIMERRGMKKVELAKRMGVSRSAVSQLFGRGAHNLTLLTIAKLASALGAEFTCEITDAVLRERRPRPATPSFDLDLEQFAELTLEAVTYGEIEEASELPAAA